MKNLSLKAFALLAIILFSFCVVKNIGYPLFWNDEGETVMYAKRILEHGFPKVHDSKNVVYLLFVDQKTAVHQETDAYLGAMWGGYYYGAFAEFFAARFDNIYTKTAVFRIFFAILGIAGLIILAGSLKDLLPENEFYLFVALFFLLEIESVSIQLHLKEARYYSVVIFLSALIFYIHTKYRFAQKINFKTYAIFFALFTFLLFNVFVPVVSVIMISFCLFEVFKFFQTRDIKQFILNNLPIALALLFIIPLFFIFPLIKLSSLYSTSYNLDISWTIRKFVGIYRYFVTYESFVFIIAVKLFLILLRRIKGVNNQSLQMEKLFELSMFLMSFLVIYSVVISKVPMYYAYQRYFILLQPISKLILLIDLYLLVNIAGNYDIKFFKRFQALSSSVKFTVIVLCVFFFQIINNPQLYADRIYEMFHQYKGPVDFVVEYIQENFEKPEDVVIATNYEECSYMYYLDSKVIVGHVFNNLEEDLKQTPDVIIIREAYINTPEKMRIFKTVVDKARYETIKLPVFGLPINNTPELQKNTSNHVIRHHFKTATPSTEKLKLRILRRIDNNDEQ